MKADYLLQAHATGASSSREQVQEWARRLGKASKAAEVLESEWSLNRALMEP
jgi:hypothetical protein